MRRRTAAASASMLTAAVLVTSCGSTKSASHGPTLADAPATTASPAAPTDPAKSLPPSYPPGTPVSPQPTTYGWPAASDEVASTAEGPGPERWRLQKPLDDRYSASTLALGNFRMDPAPSSLLPKMSEAKVVALFESQAGRMVGDDGTAYARFGLFTGSTEGHGPPPSQALTGNVGIDRRPAWIVIVPSIDLVPTGGPAGVGGSYAPPKPIKGWASAIYADADGSPLGALSEQGGPAPSLG